MKHEDTATKRGKGNKPIRTRTVATRVATRSKNEEWGGVHARSIGRLDEDNARIKAIRILIYAQMDAEQGRIDYSDAARAAWRQPTEEEIRRCIREVVEKRRGKQAETGTGSKEDDEE